MRTKLCKHDGIDRIDDHLGLLLVSQSLRLVVLADLALLDARY